MLDRTKLGFEEITQGLLQKVLSKGTWKDATLTSTGRTIIELYAYVAQLLLYYIKRIAEEQFPDTAQFWSSLVRMANTLGVPVVRPRGCFGRVKVKIKDTASVDQKTVQKFTVVMCDDTPFYVVEDTVVYKGEWKEVGVRQGYRNSAEFIVGTSGPVWQFEVKDPTASDEDVVVSVGGVEYVVVTDFFELLEYGSVRLTTGVDKSLVLTFFKAFGALDPGQTVRVEYSSVKEGYLPPTDGRWSINDSDLEVEVVPGSFSSGGTWEDIETFKSRFVNYFGVGKRIVTKGDLEKILLSLPEVEKVKVLDVQDEFKGPFKGGIVYVKPTGGWDLTTDLLDKLNSVIDNLRMLGMKVDVRGVQKVDVDVYVKVDKKFGMSVQMIENEIVEKITGLYSGIDIGQWVWRTEITNAIKELGYKRVIVVLPDKDLELKDNQYLNLRTVRVEIL